MEIMLIRHSMTAGNLLRRYVGRTDEGLCPEGIELAEQKAQFLLMPDLVYSSPMLRCRETAEILFPGKTPIIIDGLQETDFGKFEYKTYEELKDDPDYIAWLESSGTGPIPGGESLMTVKERVLEGFGKMILDIMLQDYSEQIALVAHGGTIMTLLAALGLPERGYYDWQTKNCCGYVVEPEDEHLRVLREL